MSLARAGRWLLESGIQEPNGGVARFYRSELQENQPVSTEITGYTASALAFLFSVTGDDKYLHRARTAADFLIEKAWNPALQTFPYEHPSPSGVSEHRAYFFDCGIIIRGLLAVWHFSKDDRLIETAQAAAHGMLTDFRAETDYHPVLELPSKQALPRTSHWSRSSGCYQLKSALAWFDVAEITGDRDLRSAYFELLQASLASYPSFLPAETPHQTMDRLHATSYFLEALTPVLHIGDCAAAFTATLASVSRYLHSIVPSFARADVYAQLLRARINGDAVVPVDLHFASEEAASLAAFQATSADPRIDGGYFFGCRDAVMSPHINPVSTAFALQALEMWRGFQAGAPPPCRRLMI